MKIAVMGSGGVGGYFGGRLAKAGYDVSFVARGAHLAAMREHGLKIESQSGDIHVPDVKVTDDPATIGPVDLVMFCVKLADSEGAARQVKPLMGPHTAIVSFQNGVQKDELMKREFGEAAVMGGVGYIAASIGRPGVVKHVGTMQRLLFGEYDRRRSARVEALLEACKRAGINAEIPDDIRLAIWEKFVFLVALSGTTACARVPIGRIRENPHSRAFLLAIIEEAVAVGRAQGVNLPADYAQQRLAFCDGLPAEMTSSMHHDLERGNPLEVEWLAGSVVRLGEAAGVATPANRAVRAILAPHAGGRKTKSM